MFSKKVLAALLPALVLTGCSGSTPPAATPTPATVAACLVADSRGLTDNGVNESAYSAIKEAVVSLGAAKFEKVVGAKANSDEIYAAFNLMMRRGCKVIVASGSVMRSSVVRAARANPDLAFVFIDGGTEPLPASYRSDNLKHLTFESGQSAILAGYLAGANSKTGVVATFGSFSTPSVRAAMQGFADGVQLFNNDTDSDVLVLGAGDSGWEFIGSTSSKRAAAKLSTRFLEQGADVIYPVAGAAGSGAGLATLKHPSAYVIGSERDWYMDHDNLAWRGNILASTVKQVSRSVYASIAAFVSSSQVGDPATNEYVGTLENGGVSLTEERSVAFAPQFNSERTRLQRSIISGEIPTPKGDK